MYSAHVSVGILSKQYSTYVCVLVYEFIT